MNKQYKADLALIFVTLAWGLSFILTKNSLNALSTFNFLAIRFFIASLSVAIIFYKRILKIDKTTLKYGIIIGFIMFSGYAFQTLGLNYTTTAKSAFISGLCVILVPIFSALFLKKAPKPAVIIGVILSAIGLGLLTLDDSLSLNLGDLLTLLCAFVFAFQILSISKYSVKVDTVNLAFIQISVVGFLSAIVSFLFEAPTIPTTQKVWTDILFLSFFCTSGAFIVQNTAQKYTSATHAALIFTGEPVFAAIFGYFLCGEILSIRGFIGGFLIVFSMLLAELEIKIPFLSPKSKVPIMANKK
ncbi:DMT family transporter [Crassaminicella profunda]|uniref:DMT family transporter n=1 Tax=Crassaminicella profunda TaxID=1286698 RepID=UPI001CA62FCB|nr:DMT family transporter [Crassaminicella profunda]QZY53978.1 DMT family transporter [Crassaminicella profunda]